MSLFATSLRVGQQTASWHSGNENGGLRWSRVETMCIIVQRKEVGESYSAQIKPEVRQGNIRQKDGVCLCVCVCAFVVSTFYSF